MTQALVDILQASQTSHSKSSLGNFYHRYLGELLVNVYNNRLMVKMYLAVVCVEVGFSQIWSHVNNLCISHDLQIILCTKKIRSWPEFSWNALD